MTTTSTVETRKIDAVVPYWRNPRDISDDAIAAVSESIEQYGYLAPIVIDPEGTIIAGHTRYAALRRLGYDEVRVIVAEGLTPEQVKQYRIIDNRSGEYASWDDETLTLELREWDESLLDSWFPDVDLEIGEIETAPTFTTEDIEEAEAAVTDVGEVTERTIHEVTCPECFHQFDLDRDSLGI